MQKQKDTIKEDSVLTRKAGDAKPVQEMVSSRLRCTFYQMCMSLVKYVMENDTIEKHLKLNTRERVFMMF